MRGIDVPYCVVRRVDLSLSASFVASGGRVEETGFVIDYRVWCLLQYHGDVLHSLEAMPAVERRRIDCTF